MPKDSVLKHFEELKNKGLKIDASRGKPCKAQLDLSFDMLNVLDKKESFDDNGIDARNYGALDGLNEAKNLVAELMEVTPKNVFVGGNSSLSLMYDLISKSMLFGILGNEKWLNLPKVKWLCLVPGYDRHFSICERFGIEMINVPLLNDGPDMEMVEEYIKDPTVKGMWCVPKFSNPSAITYSDKVVKEIANLKPSAKDFRVYWDNAYFIHDFDQDNPQKLLNIFEEAKKANNEDMIYEFISFSKISFPGAAISALIASENNLSEIKKHYTFKTIGFDKINQLQHVRFFKNRNGIIGHMRMHSSIIKSKFEFLSDYFKNEVGNLVEFEEPKGGYFICLKVKSCAKEVIERCAECGVKLTPAGASFPYHIDPNNEYIRIAPTCLEENELKDFADVITTAIKIETVE